MAPDPPPRIPTRRSISTRRRFPASAGRTQSSPSRDPPSARLLRVRTLARRRHLERKSQRRDLVARMILAVGQLRQAVQLLVRLLRSLIDARIEVDEVRPGRSRGGEVDDDVALAVEAARIPH